jgi:hypothetical protein
MLFEVPDLGAKQRQRDEARQGQYQAANLQSQCIPGRRGHFCIT